MKFKGLLIFIMALCLLPAFLSGQDRCSTMEHLEWLKQQNPNIAENISKADAIATQWVKDNQTLRQDGDTLLIPVVVHIVYRTAQENISDIRAFEQIDILNHDFARLNDDADNTPTVFKPFAAGLKVKFILANTNPSGNPTSGIEHVQTTITSFSTNDKVKKAATGGADAWPSNSYLNIWVANLSGGLLGYAQFPGDNPATDGVVIKYSSFGYGTASPYDLGRTSTHEVGHWLGLYHIWGDDDGDGTTESCSGEDNIEDTPIQSKRTGGCPAHPKSDICSNAIMFMNYMDYTNDACMNMFTQGQATKMTAVLNTFRDDLKNSTGFTGPPTIPDGKLEVIASPNGVSCTGIYTPKIDISNASIDLTINQVVINYGLTIGDSSSYTYNGTLVPGQKVTISFPEKTYPLGSYTFFARIVSVNGTDDYKLTNNYLTTTFSVSNGTGKVLPFSDGFEVGIFPGSNYSLIPSNADSTWQKTTKAKKSGAYSLYIPYYYYSNKGAKDEFMVTPLDFTGISNPKLYFDRAYAKYIDNANSINISDTLEILVSSACDGSFNSIYKKFGDDLATAPGLKTEFIPTSGQWKSDSVDLSAYSNDNRVTIMFRGINRFAQNLYLENINVKATNAVGLPIYLIGEDKFYLFPNPTRSETFIQYNADKGSEIKIEVRDITGKLFYSSVEKVNSGINVIPIKIQSTPGYLLITLTDGQQTGTRKLVIY